MEATKGSFMKGQRFKIAMAIVSFALLIITIIAVVTIALSESAKRAEVAISMMNSILPLLGTWVGLVLSFYFSADNFDNANASMSNMLEQVSDKKLKSVSVTEAMINYANMRTLTLTASVGLSDLKLNSQILTLFTETFTRLPILDESRRLLYIIHESVVYRFIAQCSLQGKEVGLLSLSDLLDDHNAIVEVTITAAYISSKATLAEAKTKMASIKGCQDLFVTEDGSSNSPVLGWITNSTITKYSQV